ncbi:MAG: tetratricopeptide repeat protein [Prochloraceae cyanobacterium]
MKFNLSWFKFSYLAIVPFLFIGQLSAIAEPSVRFKNRSNFALFSRQSQLYYQLGSTRYAEKNYQEAVAAFSRAIRIDREYVNAYYYRGLANYRLQQYALALTDFDRTLQLDSKYFFAYNNRGLVRYKTQEYDKAIEDFSRAIQINKNNDIA